MLFFSFSTGDRWYMGPIISVCATLFLSGGYNMLLNVPKFFYSCTVAALQVMLGTTDGLSQFLATCFLASSALFGFGSMFLLPLIRRFLRQEHLHQQRRGPTPHERPRRATTELVAEALLKMRTEVYATPEELASMSVHELKERVRGCQGKGERDRALPALEKFELVESILKQTSDTSSISCCICSEDYVSGDPLRVLDCFHRFHIECVDKWLLACDFSRNPACPLCNMEIKMKPA